MLRGRLLVAAKIVKLLFEFILFEFKFIAEHFV